MGYTTASAIHGTTIDTDDVEVTSALSDSAANETVTTDPTRFRQGYPRSWR